VVVFHHYFIFYYCINKVLFSLLICSKLKKFAFIYKKNVCMQLIVLPTHLQ